jgi:hypothetical protein
MVDENTENTVADAAANTSADDTTVGAEAELTINDLAALRTIIDVASQRGTFKPTEMVAVGTIYAKLDKFLNAAQAAQKAQDDA